MAIVIKSFNQSFRSCSSFSCNVIHFYRAHTHTHPYPLVHSHSLHTIWHPFDFCNTEVLCTIHLPPAPSLSISCYLPSLTPWASVLRTATKIIIFFSFHNPPECKKMFCEFSVFGFIVVGMQITKQT